MEEVEVYDLEENFLETQYLPKFYDDVLLELKSNGSISKQVKTIRCLLLHPDGGVYLHKRNALSKQNPSLLDKTIGGHVSKGDSFDLTLEKESLEEIGVPCYITSEREFSRALSQLDLSKIAPVSRIELSNQFLSKRTLQDGTSYQQPYINTFYIGYYKGPFQFVDGECSGIVKYDLKDLENLIQTNPQDFTEDVIKLIKQYRDYIKSL